MTLLDNDTIAAPATAAGGALCVVRVSGPRAIDICLHKDCRESKAF